MIALNLNNENRILSACKVLPRGNYDGMPVVEILPEGNICDYLYINDEFVYDPIPVVEVPQEPTQMERIEAQITYTAMMTDTLLKENRTMEV